MPTRSFLYACLGVLALAQPFCAAPGHAQSAPQFAACLVRYDACAHVFAVTESGETYNGYGWQPGGFQYVGNIFGGGSPPAKVTCAAAPTASSVMVGLANGDVYFGHPGGAWQFQGNVFAGQLLGRTLVAISYCVDAGSVLGGLASNGDFFKASDGYGTSWSLVGNVLDGSATSAQSQSIGGLKVRYR